MRIAPSDELFRTLSSIVTGLLSPDEFLNPAIDGFGRIDRPAQVHCDAKHLVQLPGPGAVRAEPAEYAFFE